MNSKKQTWKKKFFTIYAGQIFSIVSSSAAQFAIVWYLTMQTGSALTLTLASLAGFLPQALFGIFAGAWVDRLSRKAVMMAADTFVALSSLVLAAAFVWGTPPVWLIYVILFLRALGSIFHMPAMQAAIPMIVPPDQLVKAGGYGQLVQSASQMAGPVLGAIMMTGMDLGAVMLVDVAGAMIAVGVLGFVKIPDPPKMIEKQHILREILDGLRTVRHNKPAMWIALPILLSTVIFVPLGSLFPLMVSTHFGGQAGEAGLVEFTFAFGLMAASLLVGLFGEIRRPFRMISLSLLALGLTILVSGLLPPSALILFAVICIVMGATGTFFGIPYTAYMQRSFEPQVLGRVLSLYMSLMSLATPIGLFIAGPAAQAIGVDNWFVVSGIAMLLTSAVSFLVTWRFERKPMGNG